MSCDLIVQDAKRDSAGLAKSPAGWAAAVPDNDLKLHESETGLGAELELYEAIERSIPAGLAVVDDEGRQVYVNHAFAGMVGWNEEELLGATAPFVYWPPEETAAIQRAFDAILRNEVPQDGFELRFRRRNEERFDARVIVTRLKTAAGKRARWLAFVSDITAQKEAERRHQELSEQLEERISERTAALCEAKEQLESFCYTVSHDLRAPLRAIQGFGCALIEDHVASLNDEAREYLQRMTSAAQRMDSLINDLLEYSRLGRMQLEMHSIELAECMKAVLEQLQADVREKNAEIVVESPLPHVVANQTVLQQVIANLISNALKFVPADRTPRIVVRAEELQDRVRVWVEDNGIGIEFPHQESIFRVFQRLHTTERYPGTGIGLAIVKKGVERMGGHVGVKSKPGKGSRFWIELPLQLTLNLV